MSYLSDYGNSVANIYQNLGDAQARARVQQGQGWANALGQIGQSVAAIPQQMQQAKDAEQERKLRDAKLNENAEKGVREGVIASAYSSSLNPDGTFDRAKFTSSLQPTKYSTAIPDILKGLDEAEAANLSVKNAKAQAEQAEMGYIQTLGKQLIATGFDPDITQTAFAVAKAHGHDVAPFEKMWRDSPEKFQQSITTLVNGPAKPVGTREVKTMGPDGVETIQLVEDRPGQTFTSAPKPEKVTFSAPTPAQIGGKQVFVRTGSDGKTYDMGGKEINGNDAQPIRPERAPEPLEAIIGPNGQPIMVPRSQAIGKMPATNREKPTEDERKTAGFYSQMRDALATLDATEGKLTQKELYQIQSLPQEGLIALINRGELSEDAKRYVRAFNQFTESRLRPVSGAAIADTEYARDRQTYAKQFGETPTLNADRMRARNLALDSLATRAGVMKPKDDAQAPGNLVPTPPPDQSGNWKWNGSKWVKK